MKRLLRVLVVAFAGVLLGCASPACATDPRVSRAFPRQGVRRVVLRAGDAAAARVRRATGASITISGVPRGGAEGYHASDPNWRETPAREWGLDFVSKRFGDTLVVSTKNEIAFIHHAYTLGDLVIELPAGVDLARAPRSLNGEGAPDLSPP